MSNTASAASQSGSKETVTSARNGCSKMDEAGTSEYVEARRGEKAGNVAVKEKRIHKAWRISFVYMFQLCFIAISWHQASMNIMLSSDFLR